MDNKNTNEKLTDGTISAIDRAIQNANARKNLKDASGAPKAAKEPKAPRAATEPKRPRLTDEEKAARTLLRTTERAARQATRAAVRAEKLAARNASKQPAHLKKVNKAAEKLGALAQAAQLLFNEATANLSAVELSILANHILHFNRRKATERALNQTIEAGVEVTIVGGDPRFIGRTGTVTKAQRIRCYVTLEGVNKPVYLFVSDVTPSNDHTQAATA